MIRKCIAPVLAATVLALAPVSSRESSSTARAGQAPSGALPSVSGQVTFLYFNDIDKAAKFYSETLGLKSTFDQGWVRIYALSPSSFVGLVSGTEGMLRPASEKPVMVSIVVDKPADVEGALREAFGKYKDRLVFLDFITDQKENVWPMVKAGKGLTEMLLGSEDL